MPWNKDQSAESTSAKDTERTTAAGAADADASDMGKEAHSGAYTPKKGRPTPKRKDVELAHGIRRAPVEAPLTSKEARARRKEHRASLSKEELKAEKARERAQRREQRRIVDEGMAAGDPKYLLPRDQGPERKLLRDWVDSRRFIANIFLPFALVLLLVMMVGSAYPQVANIASIIAMVLIFALLVEGVYIGRKANQVARAKFPNTAESKWGLGFYAYSRASQPRRLRTPRPQKNIGDEV